MKGMMDKVADEAEKVDNPQEEAMEAPEQESEQEGFPAELQPMLDDAITTLYGDNFEKLVKLFEGGPDAFPNAMSTAINGVLGRLEKQGGEIDQEAAAQLGTKLFEMLLEDMVTGGVVQEVSPQMAVQAIQQTMATWIRRHQDQIDPNEAGQSLYNLAAALKEGGELGGAQQAGPEQPAQPQPGGM